MNAKTTTTSTTTAFAPSLGRSGGVVGRRSRCNDAHAFVSTTTTTTTTTLSPPFPRRQLPAAAAGAATGAFRGRKKKTTTETIRFGSRRIAASLFHGTAGDGDCGSHHFDFNSLLPVSSAPPPPIPAPTNGETLLNLGSRLTATTNTMSSAVADASMPPPPPGTFAPVLNVPALIAFSVIVLLFALLQMRVSAIGNAVERRDEALRNLRKIKSAELNGETTSDQVEDATREYRESLERVEDLRTVLAGIARIAPPPGESPPSSSSESSAGDNNARAARQFLGVELDPDTQAPREEKRAKDNDGNAVAKNSERRQQPQEQEQQQKGLPLPLALLLGAVALSQIGLLVLLSNDPMSSSSKDIF